MPTPPGVEHDEFQPAAGMAAAAPAAFDPGTRAPAPGAPQAVPATAGARLVSVVIDFVVLKIFTTIVVALVAGGALLALAGGSDVGHDPTYVAIALSAAVSLWYFLSSPARRGGQTIGQRIAGIGPRSPAGGPAPRSAIARHHLTAFVLPSLLLDPIAVIGARDLAVLAAWCLIQLIRNGDGRTAFEDAAGLTMVGRLP